MFTRDLKERLLYFAGKLPVIAILGPRQSGKTTLARAIFPNHKYISFEDIDRREFAKTDPRRFLRENRSEHGIILDEIQYAPDLLSYMQTIVDEEKKKGYFVITGSQNFLLTQTISQTLAGRIATLTLLPLSLKELKENSLLSDDYNNVIYYGGYPRIYEEKLLPPEWLSSYVFNYVERDVRQIITIADLSTFQRFIKLCAGRIGQLLNIASLATECGISQPTAKKWLSILEASYIIFLLQPYFENFSKRLVKSPKLYFYDTGVACHLLSLNSQEAVSQYYLRGELFENMVILELYKQFYNRGIRPNLYFWRDSHGHEIDCLIDCGIKQLMIEIKASETINMSFFNGLEYWNELTQSKTEDSFLVYGGDENQDRSKGRVISWRHINKIVENAP